MFYLCHSRKVKSVLLQDQLFSRQRQFWDKCTGWPQTDLKCYKVPQGTLKSQFSPHFPLLGGISKKIGIFHFPSSHNVTFQSVFKQLYRLTQKWLHTCDTTPPPPCPKFQSGLFHSQLLSRYKEFWDQVHRMTLKWPWTLKSQSCPVYVWQLPRTPKCRSVLLYGQPFSRYMSFWDRCTEWPPNDINAKASKVLHIVVTTTPESQISSGFALWPAVFKLQTILRQVHRMTPNNIEQ